jgi:hypothetical protein
VKINITNSNSFYAFKLDMMKVYDRVEWDYWEAIMKKLGFPQQWVKVVMGMVICIFFYPLQWKKIG